MNLVASMMVGPGEEDRYLPQALEHLGGFCDMIQMQHAEPDVFYAHEGRARQALLEATLGRDPTHILAIDCDEFVSAGAAIRRACEAGRGNGVWTLPMEEVWAADERHLWTRQDGGWRAHPVPILYRVPERRDGRWRIMDRALACGREPVYVRQLAAKALPSGASVLHFGWANRHERRARYERYEQADGGRFHTSAHLRSILDPDRKVRLRKQPWPPALEPYREALVERANREPVPA